MSFKENLDKMPDIAYLSGLDIIDSEGRVAHHIPAAEGKLGSLKLYHALAQEFGNTLNRYAAEQGQGLLDLESLEPSPGRTALAGATVETKRSALLWGVLHPPGTGRGLLMCSGV